MSQTADIKTAEKEVFRLATLDDGIWEIYLGLFFALMSFYPITRSILGPIWNLILVLGVVLILAGLAWIIKRHLTNPRTGVVKFGSETLKRVKRAHILTWGLVLVTFSVLILSANRLLNEPTWEKLPQWFTDFDIDLVFALVTFTFFAVIAYTVGLPRFYLHGVLLGFGNFVGTVLLVSNDVKFQWPIALAGCIIAVIGVSALIQFLQSYALPAKEVRNNAG